MALFNWSKEQANSVAFPQSSCCQNMATHCVVGGGLPPEAAAAAAAITALE